jgi:hypothetical protein
MPRSCSSIAYVLEDAVASTVILSSVLDAVASASSARSSGCVQGTPRRLPSPRSMICRSSSILCSAISRGVTPSRAARAAPTPAASPVTAHVAMTRVVPKATWVAEMSRPAMSMFETFFE